MNLFDNILNQSKNKFLGTQQSVPSTPSFATPQAPRTSSYIEPNIPYSISQPIQKEQKPDPTMQLKQKYWFNDKDIEFLKQAKQKWYDSKMAFDYIKNRKAKIQSQDLSKNADARTGVFENVGWAIQDFVGGAISEVPNVLWNVAEFGSKIGQYNPLSLAWTAIRAGLTDKTYWQLREEQKAQAEQFWKAGLAWKEFVQKYGAFDPKSTSAKVWEFWVDIWASLVWPNKVGILKKWANIIWAGKKLATTAKIGDIALEWWLAGAKFDVWTKWEVTKETVWIWALANVGIAWTLKWASKLYEWATKRLPASLTLGGLINPWKLDVVKKSLQVDEWIATPDDVGKWILDRVKPWNKQEIADQLIQHAEKTKWAVDDALWAIPTYFKNNEAKKALMQIRSELEWKVWLESKLSQIDEMLAKPDYTLSELNAVKRQLDDMYNMYTKTGDPTAWLKAEWLRNVRANIRKFIENEAEKYGINIRKLNNETSVARWLADGILRKDSSESVRELLTAFAPSGAGAFVWAGQAIARWEDPLTILRDAVIWWVATKIWTSTTVRTKIASALNKLSPKDFSALENYIKSWWKDAIGKKVAEKVIKEWRALPAKTITKSSDFAKPVEKSIITPQTQERAIIQESKKGLSSNIKRPNGNIINNSSNNSNISVWSKKVRKPLIKPKNEPKVIKPKK